MGEVAFHLCLSGSSWVQGLFSGFVDWAAEKEEAFMPVCLGCECLYQLPGHVRLFAPGNSVNILLLF